MAVLTAMRRILVLGDDAESIHPLVAAAGLSLVRESPDVVLTYGGDGLLLHSEREWPGVPKLALRNSRFGKKCEPRTVQEALDRLARNDLVATEYTKIRVEARDEIRVGLNDVVVHNSHPTSSVRCRVWINGEAFGGEVVGDGVVVATRFGSTAYYRSITRSIFREGLGLAFNNSTEPVDHVVFSEDSVVRVRVTRGPALVAADNDPHTIALEDGDDVVIRRHERAAVILSLPDPPSS